MPTGVGTQMSAIVNTSSRVGSAFSMLAPSEISLPVKNPPLASQPTMREYIPSQRNSSSAATT